MKRNFGNGSFNPVKPKYICLGQMVSSVSEADLARTTAATAYCDCEIWRWECNVMGAPFMYRTVTQGFFFSLSLSSAAIN